MRSVTGWFHAAAAVSCILIFILTALEVLLRFLGVRFSLSYEYCGFLLGALVFLMLPAVTVDGDHISVVNVGPERKGTLDRLRYGSRVLVTILYLAALIYLCGITTLKSFDDGIRTQGVMLTPLYIPQTSMIIGLVATVALYVAALAIRRPRRVLHKEDGA